MNELRALLSTLVALGIIAIVGGMLPWNAAPSPAPARVAAVASTQSPATASPATSTPPATRATTPSGTATTLPAAPTTNNATSSLPTASRIEHPYETPPLSFNDINTQARAALVNILCAPRSGTFSPISGSGVIIDSRGVVLTNAHVAQYVLLSESPDVDLSCSVRMGAPASPRYTPQVLAISNDWVAAHAPDINTRRTKGTGEHDWALLRLIPLAVNPTPLPTTFPTIPIDTRTAIGFPGDSVLAAGYPAEFVGGIIAQRELYPVSSVSTIDQLLTLGSGSVDLVSIGSVIEAQGGSSGGPIVNDHGKLIAIITTTSEGTTTAQRDLRGLTLNYIDADVTRETGQNLSSLLESNLETLRAHFVSTEPHLLIPFLEQLTR